MGISSWDKKDRVVKRKAEHCEDCGKFICNTPLALALFMHRCPKCYVIFRDKVCSSMVCMVVGASLIQPIKSAISEVKILK